MTTPTIEARVQEAAEFLDYQAALHDSSFARMDPHMRSHVENLRAWASALRSLAAPATQVPDDLIDYLKGIYAFLQSVAPAGLADEAFRLPPSPTRAQRQAFDAAQGHAQGELPTTARQDSSDPREDGRTAGVAQAATQGEAGATEVMYFGKGPSHKHWRDITKTSYDRVRASPSEFPLYEVRALAVINEPAPAPSKEQTNG